MKWQVLMLLFATLVAFFLGANRWRARITASSAFSSDAKAGHWSLIYADSEGVRVVRNGDSSTEPLHGFEKMPQYNSGGFDLTPDLAKIAFVDMSNYAEPALKIANARHLDKPTTSVPAGAGHQLQCPLFDTDGSVLFLETGTMRSWDMRRVPAGAGRGAASRLVAWPSGIDAGDCPERSSDGTTFAWAGTDAKIHLAKRDATGKFGADSSAPGSDFELAPDGSFFVTFDGTNLVQVDTTTLARNTIASEVHGSRTIAISPDGAWVIAALTGGYGGGGWSAFRLRDGSEVPLSFVGSSSYLSYDTRRKLWLAK